MGFRTQTTVPPPEPKKQTAIRLYEADVELLSELYPESMSHPVRRLVRKLADKHRMERGLKVLGQPAEKDPNREAEEEHWKP
jgi:hypothetical protein